MRNPLLQTTIISLTSVATFLFTITPSFAMNTLHRAECFNPGGQEIISFQDGWHAIVGSAQNMWGKDSVFDMGNNNFVQCFCPLPRNDERRTEGIQTDWLSAGNMSDAEIQQLLNSGWQLRHDGTSFGLPQNDFLVKNFSFSCRNEREVSKTFTTSVRETESNNANISTRVINDQNTGGNRVEGNTQGNGKVITGDISSHTDISTNVNTNNTDDMRHTIRHMIERIRVSVTGNGASSDNGVSVSSF